MGRGGRSVDGDGSQRQLASEIGGGRNPYAGESVLAANSHLHLLLGKVLRDASANRKPKAES